MFPEFEGRLIYTAFAVQVEVYVAYSNSILS